MFLPALRGEISQGDIFEGVDIAEVLDGREDGYQGSVILLSHDCEFDKPNVDYVLVARVLPLDSTSSAAWGAIRTGQALNAIHLPGVGHHPERFINLRFIHRLPKAVLIEAGVVGRRSISMSDDGRAALVAYIFRFFARQLP